MRDDNFCTKWCGFAAVGMALALSRALLSRWTSKCGGAAAAAGRILSGAGSKVVLMVPLYQCCARAGRLGAVVVGPLLPARARRARKEVRVEIAVLASAPMVGVALR